MVLMYPLPPVPDLTAGTATYGGKSFLRAELAGDYREPICG